MNRKRAVIAVSLATGLTVLVGGVIWLLTYQPAFYRDALANSASRDERTRQADQFVRATLRLRNGIHNNEENWSEEFDEQAINGWFAEELPTKYAGLLPEGISDPRLRIEQDGAWIAFRARRGMWSGVVNCRLKTWVAAPNELAIEIQSLRAGLIPIPVDDVVAGIVDSMNENGIPVQWKQSASGDVLVVSLDESVSHPDGSGHAVLEAVDLLPGKLCVAGRRQEAEPVLRTARKPSEAAHESEVDDVK